MKLKLNQKLYNLNGQAIKDQGQEANLKDYLANIAITPIEGDKEKMNDFWLAVKIKQSNGEIDLSAKEISRLQEKMNNAAPLIYGQVYQILEGKENPLKIK